MKNHCPLNLVPEQVPGLIPELDPGLNPELDPGLNPELDPGLNRGLLVYTVVERRKKDKNAEDNCNDSIYECR